MSYDYTNNVCDAAVNESHHLLRLPINSGVNVIDSFTASCEHEPSQGKSVSYSEKPELPDTNEASLLGDPKTKHVANRVILKYLQRVCKRSRSLSLSRDLEGIRRSHSTSSSQQTSKAEDWPNSGFPSNQDAGQAFHVEGSSTGFRGRGSFQQQYPGRFQNSRGRRWSYNKYNSSRGMHSMSSSFDQLHVNSSKRSQSSDSSESERNLGKGDRYYSGYKGSPHSKQDRMSRYDQQRKYKSSSSYDYDERPRETKYDSYRDKGPESKSRQFYEQRKHSRERSSSRDGYSKSGSDSSRKGSVEKTESFRNKFSGNVMKGSLGEMIKNKAKYLEKNKDRKPSSFLSSSGSRQSLEKQTLTASENKSKSNVDNMNSSCPKTFNRTQGSRGVQRENSCSNSFSKGSDSASVNSAGNKVRPTYNKKAVLSDHTNKPRCKDVNNCPPGDVPVHTALASGDKLLAEGHSKTNTSAQTISISTTVLKEQPVQIRDLKKPLISESVNNSKETCLSKTSDVINSTEKKMNTRPTAEIKQKEGTHAESSTRGSNSSFSVTSLDKQSLPSHVDSSQDQPPLLSVSSSHSSSSSVAMTLSTTNKSDKCTSASAGNCTPAKRVQTECQFDTDNVVDKDAISNTANGDTCKQYKPPSSRVSISREFTKDPQNKTPSLIDFNGTGSCHSVSDKSFSVHDKNCGCSSCDSASKSDNASVHKDQHQDTKAKEESSAQRPEASKAKLSSKSTCDSQVEHKSATSERDGCEKEISVQEALPASGTESSLDPVVGQNIPKKIHSTEKVVIASEVNEAQNKITSSSVTLKNSSGTKKNPSSKQDNSLSVKNNDSCPQPVDKYLSASVKSGKTENERDKSVRVSEEFAKEHKVSQKDSRNGAVVLNGKDNQIPPSTCNTAKGFPLNTSSEKINSHGSSGSEPNLNVRSQEKAHGPKVVGSENASPVMPNMYDVNHGSVNRNASCTNTAMDISHTNDNTARPSQMSGNINSGKRPCPVSSASSHMVKKHKSDHPHKPRSEKSKHQSNSHSHPSCGKSHEHTSACQKKHKHRPSSRSSSASSDRKHSKDCSADRSGDKTGEEETSLEQQDSDDALPTLVRTNRLERSLKLTPSKSMEDKDKSALEDNIFEKMTAADKAAAHRSGLSTKKTRRKVPFSNDSDLFSETITLGKPTQSASSGDVGKVQRSKSADSFTSGNRKRKHTGDSFSSTKASKIDSNSKQKPSDRNPSSSPASSFDMSLSDFEEEEDDDNDCDNSKEHKEITEKNEKTMKIDHTKTAIVSDERILGRNGQETETEKTSQKGELAHNNDNSAKPIIAEKNYDHCDPLKDQGSKKNVLKAVDINFSKQKHSSHVSRDKNKKKMYQGTPKNKKLKKIARQLSVQEKDKWNYLKRNPSKSPISRSDQESPDKNESPMDTSQDGNQGMSNVEGNTQLDPSTPVMEGTLVLAPTSVQVVGKEKGANTSLSDMELDSEMEDFILEMNINVTGNQDASINTLATESNKVDHNPEDLDHVDKAPLSRESGVNLPAFVSSASIIEDQRKKAEEEENTTMPTTVENHRISSLSETAVLKQKRSLSHEQMTTIKPHHSNERRRYNSGNIFANFQLPTGGSFSDDAGKKDGEKEVSSQTPGSSVHVKAIPRVSSAPLMPTDSTVTATVPEKISFPENNSTTSTEKSTSDKDTRLQQDTSSSSANQPSFLKDQMNAVEKLPEVIGNKNSVLARVKMEPSADSDTDSLHDDVRSSQSPSLGVNIKQEYIENINQSLGKCTMTVDKEQMVKVKQEAFQNHGHENIQDHQTRESENPVCSTAEPDNNRNVAMAVGREELRSSDNGACKDKNLERQQENNMEGNEDNEDENLSIFEDNTDADDYRVINFIGGVPQTPYTPMPPTPFSEHVPDSEDRSDEEDAEQGKRCHELAFKDKEAVTSSVCRKLVNDDESLLDQQNTAKSVDNTSRVEDRSQDQSTCSSQHESEQRKQTQGGSDSGNISEISLSQSHRSSMGDLNNIGGSATAAGVEQQRTQLNHDAVSVDNSLRNRLWNESMSYITEYKEKYALSELQLLVVSQRVFKDKNTKTYGRQSMLEVPLIATALTKYLPDFLLLRCSRCDILLSPRSFQLHHHETNKNLQLIFRPYRLPDPSSASHEAKLVLNLINIMCKMEAFKEQESKSYQVPVASVSADEACVSTVSSTLTSAYTGTPRVNSLVSDVATSSFTSCTPSAGPASVSPMSVTSGQYINSVNQTPTNENNLPTRTSYRSSQPLHSTPVSQLQHPANSSVNLQNPFSDNYFMMEPRQMNFSQLDGPQKSGIRPQRRLSGIAGHGLCGSKTNPAPEQGFVPVDTNLFPLHSGLQREVNLAGSQQYSVPGRQQTVRPNMTNIPPAPFLGPLGHALGGIRPSVSTIQPNPMQQQQPDSSWTLPSASTGVPVNFQNRANKSMDQGVSRLSRQQSQDQFQRSPPPYGFHQNHQQQQQRQHQQNIHPNPIPSTTLSQQLMNICLNEPSLPVPSLASGASSYPHTVGALPGSSPPRVSHGQIPPAPHTQTLSPHENSLSRNQRTPADSTTQQFSGSSADRAEHRNLPPNATTSFSHGPQETASPQGFMQDQEPSSISTWFQSLLLPQTDSVASSSWDESSLLRPIKDMEDCRKRFLLQQALMQQSMNFMFQEYRKMKELREKEKEEYQQQIDMKNEKIEELLCKIRPVIQSFSSYLDEKE